MIVDSIGLNQRLEGPQFYGDHGLAQGYSFGTLGGGESGKNENKPRCTTWQSHTMQNMSVQHSSRVHNEIMSKLLKEKLRIATAYMQHVANMPPYQLASTIMIRLEY